MVLYEDREGRAILEYDRPSSLFGQFEDDDVTASARELDGELKSILIAAAARADGSLSSAATSNPPSEGVPP